MVHGACETQVSFRRLIAAQGISQLGDWLYNVALLALVFERTHSSAWLGATTAARVLPIVLLGPVAGLLGDRFDRRLIMIASDVVRVGAMLGAGRGRPVRAADLVRAGAGRVRDRRRVAVPVVRRGHDPAAVGSKGRADRSEFDPRRARAAGDRHRPACSAPCSSRSADRCSRSPPTPARSRCRPCSPRPSRTGDAFRPTGGAEREPGVWAALTVGARELLRRREAARLIGADVLCSFCYGVETVVLVVVSMRLGWHESGYGVLIGAVGRRRAARHRRDRDRWCASPAAAG